MDVDNNERPSVSYDERLTIRDDSLYGVDGPPSQDRFSVTCPLCGEPQLGTDEESLAGRLLNHLTLVHHQKVMRKAAREPLIQS